MKILAMIVCVASCSALALSSVVLSHFEFLPGDHQVGFSWGTMSETDNLFFRIVRDGVSIRQITGHGTTPQPQEYSWTDVNALNGTRYTYQLWCASTTEQETLRTVVVIPPHWVALDTLYLHGSEHEVQVMWVSESEANNARFDILRNGTWVGAQPGHAGANPHSYSWVDSSVAAGGAYSYVLWAVNFDSTRDSLATTSITLGVNDSFIPHPSSFSLSAYPNPFNPSTTLTLDLPVAQRVRLTIYDVTGRERQCLAERIFTAGEHRLTFDASGLPSGIYFAKLIGNSVTSTRKLFLLK